MLKKLTAMAGMWVSIFLISPSAYAASSPVGDPHDFGAGVILGAPTGFSAKYWLSARTALDGAVGWHFGGNDRVQVHADHLWHWDLESLRVPEGRLPLYAGLGLRVIAGSDSDAGIRFPLGVSYLTPSAPLEFFVEVVPVLEFAPDTEADLDAAIGIRYYFK